MLPTPCRAAAALLLGMPALVAQAAPLSLDDALRLAEARSYQLPAQEAAAAAARQRAVAAGQRPDPVLKIGLNNLPIDGQDRFSLTRDFMTMRSVGVMQEWTRPATLAARAARFEHEAEVAEAGRQAALADLQRETAIAWLDRHFQQRLRGLLQRQRGEALLQVDATEAAHRGGRGAQADVLAARAAVLQIDDRLAAADRDSAAAGTALSRWVGQTVDDGLAAPPDMLATQLREDTLERQMEAHPQLRLMRGQEATAAAEAEAVRAARRPDPSVELMFSQRGPAYSNMVSVNVSIPWPWDPKNRQDRNLAASLAVVEQMRALREEETRARTAQARGALQQWQANRARLQRYERDLLPLATDRTQAALAAYRGGSAPLTAVLDCRRAELDIRMDQLRLDMETARLWAELRYLMPADTAPATPTR
ncbi:TolC family protein [Pseudaquabacterium rugosum]|uniref:TolC family protein n=1 Tax=Pseudaquabacterium rugosum TaxID=2984194 RepID=A0ABU9B653_9BURK